METGVVVIVELKSQRRPSQSRKESILNGLFMGKGSGIRSRRYQTSQ